MAELLEQEEDCVQCSAPSGRYSASVKKSGGGGCSSPDRIIILKGENIIRKFPVR